MPASGKKNCSADWEQKYLKLSNIFKVIKEDIMNSKRENTLQTCLSEEERDQVVKKADEEGISVSAFIRRAVRRDLKQS